MPIMFQKLILRADLQNHRHMLFVYGDNLERWGMGGQAGEMRGEINAIGLCTKRSPSVFLTNADLPEVQRKSYGAIQQIEKQLAQLEYVIWPKDGIGTGLAGLETHAPDVKAYFDLLLKKWRKM